MLPLEGPTRTKEPVGSVPRLPSLDLSRYPCLSSSEFSSDDIDWFIGLSPSGRFVLCNFVVIRGRFTVFSGSPPRSEDQSGPILHQGVDRVTPSKSLSGYLSGIK